MNNTIKIAAIATAGFIGASITSTVAGVLIYNASVREQNCLSYEKQMVSAANKTVNSADKALSMIKDVKQNPFVAFGYFPDLMQMKQQLEESNVTGNNTLYAYVGTCGEKRKSDFFARPEVASVFNKIIDKSAELSALANSL